MIGHDEGTAVLPTPPAVLSHSPRHWRRKHTSSSVRGTPTALAASSRGKSSSQLTSSPVARMAEVGAPQADGSCHGRQAGSSGWAGGGRAGAGRAVSGCGRGCGAAKQGRLPGVRTAARPKRRTVSAWGAAQAVEPNQSLGRNSPPIAECTAVFSLPYACLLLPCLNRAAPYTSASTGRTLKLQSLQCVRSRLGEQQLPAVPAPMGHRAADASCFDGWPLQLQCHVSACIVVCITKADQHG